MTTVTYTYPVAGTTPPTRTRASQVPSVTGYIDWDAGDTLGALFTHNLGLATAPSFSGKLPAVSQGFPSVILVASASDTEQGSTALVGSDVVDGNVIRVTRSVISPGWRLFVTVRAPHSMGL